MQIAIMKFKVILCDIKHMKLKTGRQSHYYKKYSLKHETITFLFFMEMVFHTFHFQIKKKKGITVNDNHEQLSICTL